MEFLVRMDTTAVFQLPDQERKEVLEREWTRGRQLHADGILRKVWRLPGQKANIGIWSARDADQLTEVLQSLPIWPLITLEVTPLATHPLLAELAREGQECSKGL
jgi:muconolactone D-isomerase